MLINFMDSYSNTEPKRDIFLKLYNKSWTFEISDCEKINGTLKY